jgi:hypothetical protein
LGTPIAVRLGQRRRKLAAMRSPSPVYLCSDLDSVARRGPKPAYFDHENRELADAIATRDEAVAVAARDRARYHTDMVVVKRVHWDSSLAETLEHRRRQDEEYDRRRAWRKECVRWSRFDGGAGPSEFVPVCTVFFAIVAIASP